MASGTVLAEIVLEGDKTFTRGIESAGDAVDDTARDAAQLTGALKFAGEALEEVRDDALGASGGMYTLRSTTDEAGDQMVDLVPKAATASGAVTTFGLSTEGASVGVTALSSSLTGALIPAVAALSTTLAPIAAIAGTAAAALGSLAGAFGLVIGSGVIAGFDQLKSTFKESIGLIKAQLTGFGQDAVPVLDNILGQLPGLASDILDAFGGTDTFLDALSEGFQTIRDVAPAVVRTLRQLATDALPVLKDAIGFLIANGPSIFREMVATTRRLAPKIMAFTDALIDAAPAILDMGTFLLETGVPAVTKLTRKVTPLIAAIGSLSDETRTVQGVFNKLPPGIQAITTPLKIGLIPALGLAKKGVNALGLDWQKNVNKMVTLTKQGLATLPKIINDAMAQARTFIDKAWTGILQSTIGFLNALLEKGTEGIEGLTNTFIKGANSLIETMNGLIRQANSLPGVDIGLFNTFSQVDFEAPQLDMPKSIRQGGSQKRREKIQVEVVGTLREENGEVTGHIKDTAQTVVKQRKRGETRRLRQSRPP